MSQVAILGSGPAGLFAALAVEHAGHEPIILSNGGKSQMFGAMYLHRALPGVNDVIEDFEIDIIKVGSKEGYAYNVYGRKDAACSWEKFTAGSTPAWDLRATYEKLWDRYPRFNIEVSAINIGSICHNFPLVLCSVPAKSLCTLGHVFEAQDIWVVHGEGTHLTENVNDHNVMYYNGVPWDGSFQAMASDTQEDDGQGHGATFTRGHEWYRFSQINKYQAWEYSREPDWQWSDTNLDRPREKSQGIKPLWNSCGCWMEYKNFHRIGRFGRWQKGVLTHQAYEEALEVSRALQ